MKRILFVVWWFGMAGMAHGQWETSYQVFFSTSSLSPAGLYGSDGTGDGAPAALYPFYGLKNVFVSTYPVVSPAGTVFARFEANPDGRFLVVRGLTDGAKLPEIALDGYNPQWFPDGRRLLCESAREGSSSRLLRVDVESGAIEEIGTLTNQFYPPGEPGGAAILSPDGKRVVYQKLSGILTPYIFDLETKTEAPLLEPDAPCLVDGKTAAACRLVSAPGPPLTVRHLAWAPDSDRVAVFGNLLVDNVNSQQGIFVVSAQGQSVVVIQLTENVSRDHPENYFFSPDGGRIVFNLNVPDVPTYRPHLFTSPTVRSSPVDLGRGSLLGGGPGREPWVLSPWSHDGLEILYQDFDNGTLRKMGRLGGSVGLTTPPVSGSFNLRDAQWTDFGAMLPPDVEVTAIKTVQVIEDVPLILEKETMVRVFVQLKRADRLDNVTVKLDFGGVAQSTLTGSLLNHDGVTYVVPPGEEETFLSDAAEPSNNYFLLRWVKPGHTSFNFLGPFKPGAVGLLKITATVDPLGELDETEDLEPGNNEFSREFPVKATKKQNTPGSTGAFVLQMEPAKFFLEASHTKVMADLEKTAVKWAYFLLSTYPVPEVEVFFVPIVMTNFKASVVDFLEPVLSLIWRAGDGLLRKALFGADRTVYMFPKDELDGLILGEKDGASFKTYLPWTVYVDETADDFTLAHEIGHTYGLEHDYGPGFPYGAIAWDGWDVGRGSKGARISVDLQDTSSPRNYYSLMQNVGVSPWITRGEYEILLRELVVGGADPKLLVVRGYVRASGEVGFLPVYAAEGILEAVPPGEYLLETLDAGGAVLTSVSFGAAEVSDGELRTVFGLPVLFDPATARLRVKKGGAVLGELARSPSPPSVTVGSPDALGGGRLRISWDASDPDGGALYHYVAYSHNGSAWVTLAMDYDGPSLEVDTSLLPGGSASRIKIFTTDGVNTVEALSPEFTVETKGPSAHILEPEEGAEAEVGEKILLKGLGYDPEDGLQRGGALSWSSSRDGNLGSGAALEVRLSSGVHQIVLTAEDSEGKSAQASVQILVTEKSGPAPIFLRGDANADGMVDISDPIDLLGHLFLSGGGALVCQDAADANDDNTVDISDAVYALSHLFSGGADFPPPGNKTCGPDPTGDDLPACVYPPGFCAGR